MAAMKTLGVRLASSSLNGARLLTHCSAVRAPRRSCSSVVVAAAQNEIQEAIKSKVKEKLPVTVAGLAASSGLAAAPAQAQESAVDTAVGTVIDLVRATGEAAKQAVEAAQSGVEYAKQAYEQVAPVVKSAVDATAPVVTDYVKTAADAASPVLKSGVEEAGKALASSGLDTSAISSGAKTALATTEQAAEVAKPFVDQAIQFLTTTEPVLLGEYALGLVAAFYLGPPIIKLTLEALRGYAGEVTPAAALDVLSSDGGAVLLDIRTAKEKEGAGLPDLPSNGKLVELELAAVAGKLRSQLRNPGQLEVTVTALQIAALKRLGKGSSIYLLDRSGGTAKQVAKELASRGFGRVFVVAGGFQGWQNSKLRTRPSSTVSRVEVLQPGSRASARIIPAVARTVQVLPPVGRSAQRALPSGRS